jgi:hypothetical protein
MVEFPFQPYVGFSLPWLGQVVREARIFEHPELITEVLMTTHSWQNDDEEQRWVHFAYGDKVIVALIGSKNGVIQSSVQDKNKYETKDEHPLLSLRDRSSLSHFVTTTTGSERPRPKLPELPDLPAQSMWYQR